jgi:hypothetical protein
MDAPLQVVPGPAQVPQLWAWTMSGSDSTRAARAGMVSSSSSASLASPAAM